MHEEKLYKYATAFGIGQRTGIFGDQGESAGLLRPVNKWSGLSITRVPMGQEVLATPIQLVTAMSVIANGGRLVVPHLARQVTDESGRVVKVYQPKIVRQVVSASAARGVARALQQVTVDGTAKSVNIQDARPAAGLSLLCRQDRYCAKICRRGLFAHPVRLLLHRVRPGGGSRVCRAGDGG